MGWSAFDSQHNVTESNLTLLLKGKVHSLINAH